MLESGVYEQLINQRLRAQLQQIESERQWSEKLDEAEASLVLSRYLAKILKEQLDMMDDATEKVRLANQVLLLLDASDQQVVEPPEELLALLSENDPLLLTRGTAKNLPKPQTSLAQSSLFTGARHEPQMYTELKKEIATADRIDLLVSFIKWSGLRLIFQDLEQFTERGGQLRIITTSYMGATDLKAIIELQKLKQTEIKVSYDTERTRLHAKSYMFHRKTGYTTCYVGSSNLSNAAMSSGLEWNVKIAAQDLPATIQKIEATFASYWESSEFEAYAEGGETRLRRALRKERQGQGTPGINTLFDLKPYNFQQEILDRLQAEREVRGHFRNLIVAATGTGKTMIAAFDYLRTPGRPKLLFVAHRREILEQSLGTFQGVLKDQNFGDLYVGNYQPDSIDHLFISIQTANSQNWYDRLPADYYDFIIVDEFHHAAAASYERLLTHFQPKILLGLTATPERMDGKDILGYFGGRIAAEIRLPEAIQRKFLSPFQYFGVADTVDLTELRWTRGSYDVNELSRIYTLDQAVALRRVDHIIRSLAHYVTDLDTVKGLGFCVSVEHAAFMARQFNEAGIPSLALTGNSPDTERLNAKTRLTNGELRFIFVVDIYNEGVDIPDVNTVLFLRPTESLTIFLQQLGRGLRLAKDKDCLTVLDFIGQANHKYNFEDKFAALLATHKHSVEHELKHGFPSTPTGCYIQLEKKAQRAILDNIRYSFNTQKAIINRIATFTEDSGKPLTLKNFLDYYHLSPEVIYRRESFSRLCVHAGVREDFQEPLEALMSKALAKFQAIDSRRWITYLMGEISPSDPMFRMFAVTVWGRAEVTAEELAELEASPIMRAELQELLTYCYDRIDFVDEQVDLGFHSPLDLHCSYSRDQLFVGLGYLNPQNLREGVKWLPEQNLDVLLVTLNKSEKDYSPTTMYEDYAINETLFHWQSQSTTSETAPTGQRYIHHREQGSRVLLFVREFKNTRTGAAPYTFLGTANYVTHEGNRPMSITWKLDRPIPAKYRPLTQKLVVG